MSENVPFDKVRECVPTEDPAKVCELPCPCRMDKTGRDKESVLETLNSMLPATVGLFAFAVFPELGKNYKGWRVIFYCTKCSQISQKSAETEHSCINCKDYNQVYADLAKHSPRLCQFKGADNLKQCRAVGMPLLKMVNRDDYYRHKGLKHKVKRNDSFLYFITDNSGEVPRDQFYFYGEYRPTCHLHK